MAITSVDRAMRLILVVGIVLVAPSPVLADHCGAAGTVSPASGPPGTTFVFETNLGAPSDLHLYRNGTLVSTVTLDGDGFVNYEIRTGPDDAGTWRAMAEVRGHTECTAEATFRVGSVPDRPDTSVAPDRSNDPDAWIPVVLAAGLAAFAAGLRRFRARLA